MTDPELDRTIEVSETLAPPAIHREWVDRYYDEESESLRDLMFDDILRAIGARPGATFLDAGCGNAAHSIRLARRGFRVRAVDSSPSALAMARENVRAHGMSARVEIERQDLLALTIPAETFEYVLCWGVLMHVPEMERALAELARVLRPGGFVVLSEANAASIQSGFMKRARRIARRASVRIEENERGIENWVSTPAGLLLAREASIPFLVAAARREGLTLAARRPGDLFDLHMLLAGKFSRNLLHRLNRFFYRRMRDPARAFGNVLLFEKRR